MIYGENNRKKTFKGVCIVAFVDFLGFSSEIKNKWNDLSDNPLDRLLSYVKSVNRNISQELRRLAPSSSFSHTYNGCRIKTFSDSTIIMYGFDHDPNDTELLIGILYVAKTISSVWGKALQSGFTVRGGIEYGDMYWGDDAIAGPSFVCAYEIESKYAETSRVMFGEKLKDKLKDALTNRLYDTNKHPRAFYANLEKRILHYLYYDIDGAIIISPHTLYHAEKGKSLLIEKLEAMQNSSGNMKAKIKYIPLLNILSSGYLCLSLVDLGIKRELHFTRDSNDKLIDDDATSTT